jgi:hypothetical protein
MKIKKFKLFESSEGFIDDELEFNFSTSAMISIVCHMHHKKYDDIDE